jgi:hypothetical protein
VIGELAGLSPFNRPVSGVVHARRELVSEQFFSDDKQLEGERADLFEVLENSPQVTFGTRRQLGIFYRRT